MRLLNYSFFIKIKDHMILYPTFTNLNYFWSFGFLCLICLITQLLSGFLLTMFYTPKLDLAFDSIEFFIRGYNNAWLVRYTHSNGASFFFIFIYSHIFRGLYYKSYHKSLLWFSGIIIWILLLFISFLGYILPWGQMSYWICMFLTSFVTVIPLAGEFILQWIWGGSYISERTLMRIYSIHFILPFILLSLSFIHISLLHVEGSSSPLGIENYDYITYYPYYFIKDFLYFFSFFIFIYIYIVFFNPNLLGDSLNYIKVDYIKTPTNIVPEWYFLPFYSMLRCMPNKTLGILCFVFSLLIFFVLPLYPNFMIITKFDLIHKILFIFFFMNIWILSFLATQQISNFIIFYSRICIFFYFLYFIFLFINLLFEVSVVNEIYDDDIIFKDNIHKAWYELTRDWKWSSYFTGFTVEDGDEFYVEDEIFPWTEGQYFHSGFGPAKPLTSEEIKKFIDELDMEHIEQLSKEFSIVYVDYYKDFLVDHLAFECINSLVEEYDDYFVDTCIYDIIVSLDKKLESEIDEQFLENFLVDYLKDVIERYNDLFMLNCELKFMKEFAFEFRFKHKEGWESIFNTLVLNHVVGSLKLYIKNNLKEKLIDIIIYKPIYKKSDISKTDLYNDDFWSDFKK